MKKRAKSFVFFTVTAVILTLLTAGVITACKDTLEDIGSGDGLPYEPNQKEPNIWGKDGVMSIDGLTFVGYGINIFEGPTFTDALCTPMLKSSVYLNPGYIDSAQMQSFESNIQTSRTLSEAYSKLDIKAEVKGKVPFFSGSVSSQYSNSSSLKKEAWFVNSIYSAITKKHSLYGQYQSPSRLKEQIEPVVLECINDSGYDPQRLFQAFGTHIILSCSIGGSANVTGFYNSDTSVTEQQLRTALSFNSFAVSGSGSVDNSSKSTEIRSNTTITARGKGGNLGYFTSSNIEQIGADMSAWANTIEAKPTIANIYQAIPIWELASSSARKNELEATFNKKVESENNRLDNWFKDRPIIEDGGVYYIQNFASQKAIYTNGKTYVSGAELVIWDHHSSDHGKWKATEAWNYSGWFTFQNVYSSQYMTVWSSDLNGKLMQYPATGNSGQLFSIKDNGDGSVFLISKLDEHSRVTVKTDTQLNGTLLYLLPDSLDRTKWKLIPAN